MSTPSKSRDETLRILRGTRRDMSKAKWLMALKRQPKSVRREAAFHLLDTEQAILALGNAQLAAIRDKLIANEQNLRDGRDDLKKARENLNRVKTLLGKLSKLLDVVAKVVRFTTTG